jgi:hypothetical protein
MSLPTTREPPPSWSVISSAVAMGTPHRTRDHRSHLVSTRSYPVADSYTYVFGHAEAYPPDLASADRAGTRANVSRLNP